VIDAWLELPAIGIFVILAIVYGCTATLIAWLTFWSPLRARIQGFRGLSTSYAASVWVLFALLTGFLVGDVMDRNKQAVRAVQLESGALSNLNTLALASTVDPAAIRQALHAYVDAVVNDEWMQMADAQISAKADVALGNLVRTVSDPRIAPAAGQAVHYGLVELVLQAATARADRLALNSRHSDDVKWATVLFLFFMTQLAIGMAHLEHARVQAAALTIFTISAIVALGLIAMQENPFDGTLRVSPAPLERVLQLAAG
jgi:hypothetical protein